MTVKTNISHLAGGKKLPFNPFAPTPNKILRNTQCPMEWNYRNRRIFYHKMFHSRFNSLTCSDCEVPSFQPVITSDRYSKRKIDNKLDRHLEQNKSKLYKEIGEILILNPNKTTKSYFMCCINYNKCKQINLTNYTIATRQDGIGRNIIYHFFNIIYHLSHFVCLLQ